MKFIITWLVIIIVLSNMFNTYLLQKLEFEKHYLTVEDWYFLYEICQKKGWPKDALKTSIYGAEKTKFLEIIATWFENNK